MASEESRCVLYPWQINACGVDEYQVGTLE